MYKDSVLMRAFSVVVKDFKQQRRHCYQNKHLGNGDYFVIIASCSHPLLLTEHAAILLVEAPLN